MASLSDLSDEDVLILDKAVVLNGEMARSLFPFGIKPRAVILISEQEASRLQGYEIENMIRQAEEERGKVHLYESTEDFLDYRIGTFRSA